jgi:outer membrane protein
MKRLVKTACIIAAALFAAMPAPALAKEGKIGYVNLSLVFDTYEKTKSFDLELEKEAEQKRSERQGIADAVKRLRDEIELLSPDKRGAKQQEIEEKIKELQAFDKEAREGLRRKRDAMLREILQEIDTVVKEFGDKEGYEYILNDRVLLYKSDANDLSQRIIDKLNAKR